MEGRIDMGKQFTKLEPSHKAFIERQKVFFVASAAPMGRVNVSPKGLSSLRVLGDNDVAYLDCTGSGDDRSSSTSGSGRLIFARRSEFWNWPEAEDGLIPGNGWSLRESRPDGRAALHRGRLRSTGGFCPAGHAHPKHAGLPKQARLSVPSLTASVRFGFDYLDAAAALPPA
jgi:hypothetical protein